MADENSACFRPKSTLRLCHASASHQSPATPCRRPRTLVRYAADRSPYPSRVSSLLKLGVQNAFLDRQLTGRPSQPASRRTRAASTKARRRVDSTANLLTVLGVYDHATPELLNQHVGGISGRWTAPISPVAQPSLPKAASAVRSISGCRGGRFQPLGEGYFPAPHQ